MSNKQKSFSERLERITMDLTGKIQKEITRCRELYTFCDKPPAIYFREVMLRREIAFAEKAIAEYDIVEMSKNLENLKTFE